MPGRTSRRRLHKRLARRAAPLMTDGDRRLDAARLLIKWRAEAFRRAEFLNLPRVWELAEDPTILALIAELDPGGGMLADLRKVFVKAINCVSSLSAPRRGMG